MQIRDQANSMARVILTGMALTCITVAAPAVADESTKTPLPGFETVFACSNDGQFAVGHELGFFPVDVGVDSVEVSDPNGFPLSGLKHFENGVGTKRFPSGLFPDNATIVNVFLPAESPRRVLITAEAGGFESAIFWDVDTGAAEQSRLDLRLTCVSQNGRIAYAFDFSNPRNPIRFVYDGSDYDPISLQSRGDRTSLEACSADGSIAYGYVIVGGNFAEIVRFDVDNGYSRIGVGDPADVVFPSVVPTDVSAFGNRIVCSDDGRTGYSTLESPNDTEWLVKLKPDLTSEMRETPRTNFALRLGCTPSGSEAFGTLSNLTGGGDGAAFVWDGDFMEPDLLNGMIRAITTASNSSGSEFYGNSEPGGGAAPKPFLYKPSGDQNLELGEVLGFPEVNHLFAASRDGTYFYCRLREPSGGDAVYLIERGDGTTPPKPRPPKVKKEPRQYGSLANYYSEQAFGYATTALSAPDGYGNGYYGYLYSYYALLYGYYAGTSIAWDGNTGLTRGDALEAYLKMRSAQVLMSYWAQYYSYQQYTTAPSNDALIAFYISYYAYVYGDADNQQP